MSENSEQDVDALRQRVAALVAEAEKWHEVRARLEQADYERHLLRCLMEYLPDSIYFKDLQGRFIRINQGKALRSGLHAPTEAIGKSDSDFFSAEHARDAAADEEQIIQTRQPLLGKEEHLVWPDGRETWVSTSKLPLYDDDGRVIGTFGVSRDITVQKKSAEALKAAKEAAEAASRAKSTFLANMSHEIRTPLNAIIGMTELVLKSPLAAQQRDYLQSVRDSGEALLSVINDVLDFSKIEAGKLTLDSSVIDLRARLADTVKSFALQAERQGLELAWFVHPDVPRLVVGDYNRLRQIVVNLVGNAVKFTEQGEVSLEVLRESQSQAGVELHFIVADTGIGIPREKQQLIFEMFEQADASTTRRYGGTGLGLAIAARLAGLMEGRLWVESELGRGSRFHFVVRLGLTDDADPDMLRDSVKLSAAGEGQPAASGHFALGTKLHILLAEDSLINQKLASALLEEEGHTVTAVSNGCEACDLLEHGEFDLVLMDVQMPEMDGLEATRIIRDRERSRKTRIPIIAMTARALAGDREKCLETGMDDYVVKPIRPDELFRAIGKALAAPRPKAAAAAPTAFPPGAIDWTVAMRAVRGNLRLLRTIVEIAVKEIPALIATLREAVAAGKAPELQLAAHTLKGVIRYFASSEGFAHVRQLEKMGQCKNLEQAQQTLGCLEAETEPLVVALAEYLQKEQAENA